MSLLFIEYAKTNMAWISSLVAFGKYTPINQTQRQGPTLPAQQKHVDHFAAILN